MINRVLFVVASVLGGIAIVWMGASFLGGHALALGVTVVIGLAYLIGIAELLQFRRTTHNLEMALDAPPAPASEDADPLEGWLSRLHPSLRHVTKLRIEGQRILLPAPVLTPYLVGLLVMLGLLGTFFGMVDTLSGAVVALQGNTDLAAIRAGLAAPIAGLGVAFGTSVAGVAASAMLGLGATLSRRERMVVVSQLDIYADREFRHYSSGNQQQRAFDAMHAQAAALPAIVEKLDQLVDKVSGMTGDLGERLLANQAEFHSSAATEYRELARSVDASLKVSLAESGRLAGDSIRPAIESAMANFNDSTSQVHTRLSELAVEQSNAISRQAADSIQKIQELVADGVSRQQLGQQRSIEDIEKALTTTIDQVRDATRQIQDVVSQGASDQQHSQQRVIEQFEQTLAGTGTQLLDTANKVQGIVTDGLKDQQRNQQRVIEQFEQTLNGTGTQLLDTATRVQGIVSEGLGEQQRNQQRIAEQFEQALSATVAQLAEAAQQQSEGQLTRVGELLAASEQLLQARMESESTWLAQHSERMEALAVTIGDQLGNLRSDEEQRGAAALERLSALEGTVTEHLGKLGTELEAPMTRLIETASETPRAAAEVITRLREELSNSIDRDNQLLEERQLVLERLQVLLSSLESSSGNQREAVEQMVASSASALADLGERFGEQVGDGMSQMSGLTDDIAGSAAQVASLGDAFQQAVQQFGESNQALIDSLDRIEQAMDQASTRSDEQLGYYVAQAREIIDHSMLSQKEIIEELRHLGRQEELFEAEA